MTAYRIERLRPMELQDDGLARPLPDIVEPDQHTLCTLMDELAWEIEDEYTEISPYTHVISTSGTARGHHP